MFLTLKTTPRENHYLQQRRPSVASSHPTRDIRPHSQPPHTQSEYLSHYRPQHQPTRHTFESTQQHHNNHAKRSLNQGHHRSLSRVCLSVREIRQSPRASASPCSSPQSPSHRKILVSLKGQPARFQSNRPRLTEAPRNLVMLSSLGGSRGRSIINCVEQQLQDKLISQRLFCY